MTTIIPFGKTSHRKSILTLDANRARTAPDSTPAIVNVQKNGVDALESAVSIVQVQDDTPAPVVGSYQLVLDLTSSGLNVTPNDHISILLETTIAGYTLAGVADFTVAEFSVDRPSLLIA